MVGGGITASINDFGPPIPPITSTLTLIAISVNRNTETTATMSLTTPLNGTIPLTYAQSADFGSYSVSEYGTFTQFTWVPNATYSVAMTTSLGTAYCSVVAPGNITFSANGASVTAGYPGDFHSGAVSRMSPSPASTYQSPVGVNIGSPFTYPGSAYSSPSFPAQFGAVYVASRTSAVFTGTAGAFGGVAAIESVTKMVTR
jgi:hypothetical protein